LNTLGANFRAALGDVAVADSLRVSQFFDAIFCIEWMHLQCGDMNQETWPDEFVVHLVVAQHVADILTEKTLDAFPEFLDTIDVFLLHSPGTVRRVGGPRLEGFDFFLHAKIPGNIGDQVFDDRKSFDRLDGDGLFQRELTQSGHAHELWHAVNFGRAGPALSRLAVPPAGEIGGLRPLDVVHRVEHDHAFGDFGSVRTKLAALGVTAPDFENSCFHRESLNRES